jgi:hypothetical protein
LLIYKHVFSSLQDKQKNVDIKYSAHNAFL